MRIWSIHPQYLDQKGLVACWRETLLAQAVLKNETKGYKNHPQLERFKKCNHPLRAIGYYLTELYEEAKKRGYNFNANKIDYLYCFPVDKINVTEEQLQYEFNHLLNKLEIRDKFGHDNAISLYSESQELKAHPLFNIVKGKIETWEKV